MLIVHRTTVKTHLFLSDFKFFFSEFPGKAFRWSILAIPLNGEFFTKWDIFPRSQVRGSKKFPLGQAPEPTFCSLRLHLVSTSQILSSNGHVLITGRRLKILLRDNIGSVTLMFGFVSIVGETCVLEKSVPPGKNSVL